MMYIDIANNIRKHLHCMKGGVSRMKADRDRILWLLVKNNLTQTWLINRLSKDYGIVVSKTVMSDVLRGVRRNETANTVIRASLDILEGYEKWQSGEFTEIGVRQ